MSLVKPRSQNAMVASAKLEKDSGDNLKMSNFEPTQPGVKKREFTRIIVRGNFVLTRSEDLHHYDGITLNTNGP